MAADKTPTAPRRAKAAPQPPRQKRAARRQAVVATSGETPAAIAPPSPKEPSGKLGIVVGLMQRPDGATVAQMGEATGWQPHSVRGALAGALKRKHKLTIVGEPGESGRVYRIAVETPA